MRRILTKTLLIAAMVAGVLGALALAPVSENDYLKALIDKERRLDRLPAGKVVLVGGSNLAFGMDTAYLESRLGRPAVNMGLHAALGLPFMLKEIRPHVAAGDLIVLSPEYELFKSRGTIATRELCLAATYSPPLRYLGYGDSIRCAVIALQLRTRAAARKAMGSKDPPSLYARGSFDDRGDLVVPLPRPQKQLRGAPSVPEDPRTNKHSDDESALAMTADFAQFARDRGARVVFLPPVLGASAYAAERRSIEDLFVRLRRALQPRGVDFVMTPRQSVYPDAMFFDTLYHLAAPGRALRTQAVAAALARYRRKDEGLSADGRR
jgi:hypothetical protein